MSKGTGQSDGTGPDIAGIRVIIAFVLAIAVFIFVPKFISNQSEPTKSIKSPSLSTGMTVYLPYTALGSTKDNYSRVFKLLNADDEAGVRQMAVFGQAYIVGDGTRATVIQTGVLTIEVKILDGKSAGNYGWIAREMVRFNP